MIAQHETTPVCHICGANRHLDRHHVIPRSHGGKRNPAIHSEANLLTLCRTCHRKIHEGRWQIDRSPKGVTVIDKQSGRRVMRRLINPGLDLPSTFHVFNLAEATLTQLLHTLPYFTDDQLVEAYAYTCSFGKRSWLVQAAILYEAQQRSVYGERTLEAIARRFQISLRQAQKYALVWKVFFAKQGEEENVNIDAIVLDEPSWYLIAASETKDPERWLGYAQDRKMEDPRYSVATFRRDILLAHSRQRVDDTMRAREAPLAPDEPLATSGMVTCPWVRLLCTKSGRPVPYHECKECGPQETTFCETKPTATVEVNL